MTAGTNNFLPFGTGSSPNVIDDATYNGLTARGTGFQSGVAQSQQLNKVWRQSSVIAAAIGQLIANTGANASDGDSIATLVANIRTALAGNVTTQIAVSAATTLTAAQAGSLIQMQSGAGVYALTLPAANAVVSGACYHFFNINNTYTHTVQRGGTDTIYVNGSTVNSLNVGPGDTLILASNGSNSWVPVGGSAHLPYSAVWANPSHSGNLSYGGTLTGGTGVVNIGSGQIYKDTSGNVVIGGTNQLQSGALTVYGSVVARNSGVDASYQPAFIAQYSGNSSEANAITTAVSGTADSSGFRFDVSNGYGSASRTTALEVTRANLKFNSGYGSVATAYGCRAWVNFNGTGTVAIRGSGNVSSITDRGVGQYTVNMTAAMPDANYASTTAIRKNDATEDGNMGVVLGSTSTSYSTTAFALTTRFFSNEGLKDAELVCASVFR